MQGRHIGALSAMSVTRRQTSFGVAIDLATTTSLGSLSAAATAIESLLESKTRICIYISALACDTGLVTP